VVAISAATQGWLALRADGTVAAWDYLYQGPRPLPLPPGLTNLVAITSGLGLRSDGTVAAWNYNGQALSPPNDWTNLVAIAGWGSPYLGLRANGTVLAWGSSFAGQTNVPPALTNVVAIAAGANFAVALSGLPPGSAPPQFIEPAFLTTWRPKMASMHTELRDSLRE